VIQLNYFCNLALLLRNAVQNISAVCISFCCVLFPFQISPLRNIGLQKFGVESIWGAPTHLSYFSVSGWLSCERGWPLACIIPSSLSHSYIIPTLSFFLSLTTNSLHFSCTQLFPSLWITLSQKEISLLTRDRDLKGQCHEIFWFRFFFMNLLPDKPLKITLG